jgi:FkbH-like protein
VTGATLSKAMQQHLLLGAAPSRRDLSAYAADWPLAPLAAQVVRNCPFESVAALAAPFLAHADLAVGWFYSDYDDSLSLSSFDDGAGVVLIWLDYRRYSLETAALAAFLEARLTDIRARTGAPILIADDPDSPHAAALNRALAEMAGRIGGLHVYPRGAVAAQLGGAFHDARMAKLAGSDLSAAAGALIARELGLSWLPALVRPALKAIALDLDNTLYSGVLGEDGAAGLVLTEDHRALQQRLAALQASGLLLALVSKNEAEDVDALFAARPDFPLRPEMITARAIGWGSKRAGLSDIAAAMNIGADAILFVDDNLGEIAQAEGLAALHAADPATTLRALDLFPGLRQLRAGREDALRAGDIAANRERARLSGDGADYRAALKPRLAFRHADAATVGRAHELSNKTNQFNLALARLTEAQAASFARDPDAAVIEAALSDALSDSGVVMALFARRQNDALVVEDLCISCRALGRGIEDAMILEAALAAASKLGAKALAFRHASSPRNGPARTWLQTFSDAPLAESGLLAVTLQDAAQRLAALPVDTHWD